MNSLAKPQYLKRLQRILISNAMIVCCLILFSNHVFANSKINLDHSDPFVISIEPQHQSLIDLDDISASLGEYDVSAMLVYEKGILYLNHSSSVPPGSYLVIIEVANDEGEDLTVYNKRITFYRENWQTGTELTTSASYALDSEQNSEFADEVERLSESALRLQAKRFGQNFHITTQLDAQHRTDGSTLSGENLELPNYYIGIEKPTQYGKLGFAIGNQAIESNGLVFNGFNRRGISASLSDEQGLYAVKAFVMNTDPTISSKRDLLFSNDKDSRSKGVTFDFLPYDSDASQVSLIGGYLDSQSLLSGIGIGINYDVFGEESHAHSYGGKTWFIGTNSHWFEESLSLQIEKAQSQIDIDGFEFGEPEQEDHASRYRLAINSRGLFKEWLEVFELSYWELSLQQQEVGVNYFSMANAGLAGDLQNTQSSLQLSWTEVQVLLNGLKVQNNIDNNESLATQTSKQNQIQISYNPKVEMEDSFWERVGRPSFSVQFGESSREQKKSDALLVGADLDEETLDSKFTATFQQQKFNWSLQHTRNKFINNALSITPDGQILATPRSDSKNNFTSLALSYSPQANWSFSPTLQKSTYDELATGNSQTSVNLGFQASMSFLTDTLVVYLSHNSSKQDSLFAEELLTQTYQNIQSSLSLNWMAKKAINSDPGLNVAFSSIWNESEISSQDAVDSYQLLLKLEVYWAAGEE
jgi:hypothetical protein